MDEIKKYEAIPISTQYPLWSSDQYSRLQNEAECEILEARPRLKIENSYWKMGLAGSGEKVFARKAVIQRLNRVLDQLPLSLGLVIFDVFRSRQCQKSLYEMFKKEIREKNPALNEEALHEQTLQFVADPDGKGRYAIPPHNTGGAIDLGIWDFEKDEIWDFGTPFDALEKESATRFFEKDPQSAFARRRRVLFHLMIGQGFTNFANEWWHFDLGNCPWSQHLGVPWVFESMESSVGPGV